MCTVRVFCEIVSEHQLKGLITWRHRGWLCKTIRIAYSDYVIDLYMKPKAAKAFSPMSDSRCRSLNKLLPDLEAKLIVDNIKSHLHIDTGGFLNEVEIIEVFSGHSRVEHVRSLFSVLKTKDNATFGSFCLILSKSGYGHWSKALMEEAGLDHNYKGMLKLTIDRISSRILIRLCFDCRFKYIYMIL